MGRPTPEARASSARAPASLITVAFRASEPLGQDPVVTLLFPQANSQEPVAVDMAVTETDASLYEYAATLVVDGSTPEGSAWGKIDLHVVAGHVDGLHTAHPVVDVDKTAPTAPTERRPTRPSRMSRINLDTSYHHTASRR